MKLSHLITFITIFLPLINSEIVINKTYKCKPKTNTQTILFSKDSLTINGVEHSYEVVNAITFQSQNEAMYSINMKSIIDITIEGNRHKICKLSYGFKWILASLVLELPALVRAGKLIYTDLDYKLDENIWQKSSITLVK